MTEIDPQTYPSLLQNISRLLAEGRKTAVQQVNHILIDTYWHLGKYIVEFEQAGQQKAEYGSALLLRLSKDLNQQFGKGFSKSSLYLMRQLYVLYPIFQTLSGKLSWSH